MGWDNIYSMKKKSPKKIDLIICFIDDSDFEHDLVLNEIAPCAPGLDFVQAHTFEEAREILGKRIPILFLLDLWGQDPDVDQPYLTPKEELKEIQSRFNSLDQVYEGLEDYRGDRNNEYLKRLFTIVHSWRTMFETACDRIGQNRKYGLANLKQVRSYYPGIPAVFYTRKSLINDAVAMIRAGTDGLFIKPTGNKDSETRRLTREYATELIEALSSIVDSGIQNIKRYKDFYTAKGLESELNLDALISSWKEFRNK